MNSMERTQQLHATLNEDANAAVASNQRVVVRRSGLVLEAAPVPEPGRGEVRVRVRRAGVAFADVQLRRGARPGVEKTPGFDLVGDIHAVGPGSRRRVGERVAALPIEGGYAKYIVVSEDRLLDVPREVPLTTAACLPLNYLTAYEMLHRVARVARGGIILVWGAAGGVGSALLELARAAGIRAIGACSPSKREWVESRGAIAIDSAAEDFVPRLRALAPGGVDAVFDGIGGGNFVRSARALRRGGSLVAFGSSSVAMRPRARLVGIAASLLGLAAARLMGRRVRIYGLEWEIPRAMDRLRSEFAAIVELARRGILAPSIWMELPLAEAARAHAEIERRAVVGKILLRCDEDGERSQA